MTRDILEILQVENIPILGVLLLVIFTLGWFYNRSLKVIDGLRVELDNERKAHQKVIEDLNKEHKQEIKEMNDKLIAEIRKQGKAYEHVGTALEMIMKSQPK